MNKQLEEILNTLTTEERSKTFEYLEKSEILNNPILEQYFVFQYQSAQRMNGLREDLEGIEQVGDKWRQEFVENLQQEANVFMDSMAEFVAEQTYKLKQESDNMAKTIVNLPPHVIQSVRDLIEHEKAQFEKDMTARQLNWGFRLAELTETERNKILKELRTTMKTELKPAVENVFGSTLDKFKLKVVCRDIGVVLIAFGLFQGIKAILF
ncbi:hypothetical protein [Diaphorobacter aerolatus]|uniref:Uncharacterized protein n=1 Tax=Diaphorobacter aerolatus TaxID=1288495 RepID=A0A7H0GJA6_9BURK|nr:hypothetical protein [Diaphorobacter aerolatus]QNP48372.1 hypothetical protein H9K75_20855 [Diaphorobacter aerolatus]